MKKIPKILLFATAAATSSAVAASAATLMLETSFDVNRNAPGINAPPGPDALGLSGSRITATAIFDDGTVFTTNGTAASRVLPSAFTYTISGASVAATNGIYSAGTTPGAPTTVGLFFASSNDGFFTSGPGTNIFTSNPDFANLSILGLGQPNTLKFTAQGSTGGSIAIGSALTLAQLEGISFGPALSSFSTRGSGGTNYNLSNFSTTASIVTPAAVPLPASLPLLGLGIFAAGAIGKRRKRRAA